LLGATLKGEGVPAPIACRGCIDHDGGRLDCFFEDDICMEEITANDVLEALCA